MVRVKYPDGRVLDIDLKTDEEENGGSELEDVVMAWVKHQGDKGINARELSRSAGITCRRARERLINLWENGDLRCEDEGDRKGVDGRFFLEVVEEPEPGPTDPEEEE